MKKLSLYSVFHLNLAYSSLADSQLTEVIEKCYKPLFELVDKFDIGIGIEATGYTLEKINEYDPILIEKLKKLIVENKCEFIGSGYTQLIGPLVPAAVNNHNLRIGNEIYQQLLQTMPRVAFVNEQAYSRGLLEHYIDAGFQAIIMEWNNPRKYHPEWDKELHYQPQIVTDNQGREIKLIWNDSVAFQKFQRYATQEIELAEYQDYLAKHLGESERFFPIYGSDAEVFNFRTMRYHEEAKVVDLVEWQRIEDLISSLNESDRFQFAKFDDILNVKNSRAFNKITLETSDQPIVVKKRETYNLTRWALTGRDDIGINTKCYQIYSKLFKLERAGTVDGKAVAKMWKQLCYFWASDFRTHIEENRFRIFVGQLDTFLSEVGQLISDDKKTLEFQTIDLDKNGNADATGAVKQVGRHLIFDNERIYLKLNKQKGMAIESLIFKKISDQSLVGTLQNGYYDDISFSEDFFSGHTSIEIPMKSKITDLEDVSVSVSTTEQFVLLRAKIGIGAGVINKTIKIFLNENKVSLNYNFDLKDTFPSAFRTAILTFNPEAFNRNNLFYACHNGGNSREIFEFGSKPFTCGHLLSHLISSGSVLGNTNGCLEIGNDQIIISLQSDNKQIAALPMIEYVPMSFDNYFLRTYYSVGEFDETSLLTEEKRNTKLEFSLTIMARHSNLN